MKLILVVLFLIVLSSLDRVYAENEETPCEKTHFLDFWWFCDLSNFHTMIIEISIGLAFAGGLFFWQYDLRKKRREHGQASFVTGLYFLKEKIIKQKDMVNDFHEKKITLDEITREYELAKNTTQYLRFAIGISHDTMDTSIIKAIETICTFVELTPTTDSKERDEEHYINIIKMIDKLFDTNLKKAKKLFDEVRNDARDKALKELKDMKKNS